LSSLRFKICINICPFLYSPVLKFQQFGFTAVKICGVGSSTLDVNRSVQMFELQYLPSASSEYVSNCAERLPVVGVIVTTLHQGSTNPGDVSVAAPDILSIITAVLSFHTKMCVISHAPGENRQTALRFRDVSTVWPPLYSLFHSSGAQNLGNAYRFLEIVHSVHYYYYYYIYPPCLLLLAKPLFGCYAFVQDVDIWRTPITSSTQILRLSVTLLVTWSMFFQGLSFCSSTSFLLLFFCYCQIVFLLS